MTSDYENLEVKPKIENDDDDEYVPAGLSILSKETTLKKNPDQIYDYYAYNQSSSTPEVDDQSKVYADLTVKTPKLVKVKEIVEKKNEVEKKIQKAPQLTERKPIIPAPTPNLQFPPIPVSLAMPLPMMLTPPSVPSAVNQNYFHRPPPHFYPPPSYPIPTIFPRAPYLPVRFQQTGTTFEHHYPFARAPIPVAVNSGPGMYMMMINGVMQLGYTRPNDPVLNIQRQIAKNQKQQISEAKKLDSARKKEERLKRLEIAKAEKEERKKIAKLAKIEARNKKTLETRKYCMKSVKTTNNDRFTDEPSTKRYMAFSKDTFVIRLRDVDSFDRNNEIWRIDNHVLIQKFTGVPSLRAPARQFQSTNRLSGYDMRAVWRFFVIDPENVEFDRYSSEITIHSFPGTAELREAQKVAIERDLQFKDVELDEMDEMSKTLRNKKIKKRDEKRALRLEKMKKRAAAKKILKLNNNRQHLKRTATAYKLPKRIKFDWQKQNSNIVETDNSESHEEESVFDECRDVLYSLVDAVVEYEQCGGNDENSSDDVDSATDSDASEYDIELRSIYGESEHCKEEVMDEGEYDEELYDPETIEYDNEYECYDDQPEVKMEIYEEEDIPAVALELTIEDC